MAKIEGSVGIGGFIAPFDSIDSYHVVDQTYVKGGLRTVQSFAERDAISTQRLEDGMLVYVRDDGKYYRLLSDKQSWAEAAFQTIVRRELFQNTTEGVVFNVSAFPNIDIYEEGATLVDYYEFGSEKFVFGESNYGASENVQTLLISNLPSGTMDVFYDAALQTLTIRFSEPRTFLVNLVY